MPELADLNRLARLEPPPAALRRAAFLAALLLGAVGCNDVRPSGAPPAGTDSEPVLTESARAGAREHEEWRARRLASLRSPDGWPSVIGLYWLSPGSHRLGTSQDNQIVLPDLPSIRDQPGSLATLLVSSGQQASEVQIEAAPGARLSLNGRQIQRSELLSDHSANPSVLRVGSLSLRILERGGELALRVRDLESSRGSELTEIPAWPYNPGLVLEGRLEERSDGTSLELENVAGQTYEHPSLGDVVVEIGGAEYALAAVGASLQEPVLIIVADETNGAETYAGGRYLAAQVESGGRVMLDLNRLYNPPCVFTQFATCPLPPASNRVAWRIEGGEKLPADH